MIIVTHVLLCCYIYTYIWNKQLVLSQLRVFIEASIYYLLEGGTVKSCLDLATLVAINDDIVYGRLCLIHSLWVGATLPPPAFFKQLREFCLLCCISTLLALLLVCLLLSHPIRC